MQPINSKICKKLPKFVVRRLTSDDYMNNIQCVHKVWNKLIIFKRHFF